MHEVALDDGAEVLVVGDVLGQRDEGHGREQHEDVQHAADALELGSALPEHAGEGELGHVDQADAVKGGQVDDLQRGAAGGIADEGQHQTHGVGGQDADDERNHLHALGALDRRPDGDEEGEQAQQDAHEAVAAAGGVVQVVHGAAAQGQTDQRDGGADDHRGKQLVDPAGAGLFDDQRDDGVDQTREDRAQEHAQIAEGDRADQRLDEREGAAEEHGALAPGDEEIEQRAEACAAQRSRLAHVGRTAVEVDQHGHQQRGGHDGENLLEGVDEVFTDRRFVIGVVDQFHVFPLRIVIRHAFKREKNLAAASDKMLFHFGGNAHGDSILRPLVGLSEPS